jgi:hypothetical protein
MSGWPSLRRLESLSCSTRLSTGRVPPKRGDSSLHMMCGCWVFAMLQAASVAETSVGISCGVLSLALGSLPLAEAVVPGIAGALISAGPLGIAFGVVGWLLLIYVPQVKAERLEERKAWTDERAAIFARHEVELDREREDCIASTKRLIERVEQLELKLDHIGEKVVQK